MAVSLLLVLVTGLTFLNLANSVHFGDDKDGFEKLFQAAADGTLGGNRQAKIKLEDESGVGFETKKSHRKSEIHAKKFSSDDAKQLDAPKNLAPKAGGLRAVVAAPRQVQNPNGLFSTNGQLQPGTGEFLLGFRFD